MRTFVAVAETGSFSRAAQKFGIANASVTEAVKQLEEYLGVQLLNRTTRSVRPTFEGATYYSKCRTVLSDIEELEAAVSESHSQARGRLTVEVPAALGHCFIVPALNRFTESNPEIKVVVLLEPSPKKLIERGIDVSLQLGELADSNLIAKKLCNTEYVACAAPDYLDAHGHPDNPGDLRRLNCMGFFAPNTGRLVEWDFQKGGKSVSHTPDGRLNFNSSMALIDVALRGAGVIYILDLLVKQHLKDGALVPVLPDWRTTRRSLYLVYPQKRFTSKKTKAFISFIEQLNLHDAKSFAKAASQSMRKEPVPS
jgi:LysR family transcriptional regulator for bpeEF and oprC